MKDNVFNELLSRTIAYDCECAQLQTDSFSALCSQMQEQRMLAAKRKKVMTHWALPIVVFTIAINLFLLIAEYDSVNRIQTMEMFAHENFVNVSTNYFSEVLVSE